MTEVVVVVGSSTILQRSPLYIYVYVCMQKLQRLCRAPSHPEKTEVISRGFHPRALYIPPLRCHPVVLIMSVFDLQLSLSQREILHSVSLYPQPPAACLNQKQRQPRTKKTKTKARERQSVVAGVQKERKGTEGMQGKWSKCITKKEKYETNMINNIQI